MRKILRSTKKYLPFIILTPIIIMVEVMLEVNIPLIMGRIVDYGIPSNDLNIVLNLGVRMVLIALLSLFCGSLGSILSSTGSIGFGSELRKEVFNKILNFSFENVDSFQQSSLLTRLTTDVMFIQQGLRMTMVMAIRAPFMMIAAATVAYGINKDLFIVFVVGAPILIITIVFLAKKAIPMFRYMLTKYDGLNDRAKEYLTNIRVVKSFVREDYEVEKFKEINYELMTSSIKVEKLLVLISPIMMVVIYSTIIAILWLGGNQIMIGTMLTGELISFISYVGQILAGLIMLAMIFLNFVRLKGSVERVNEVLSTDSLIVDGDYEGTLEDGSIQFNDVTFRYALSSKDAIINANLDIASGETIGIIGSTGSGKSSLVQLIARLYDVTSGSVIVGKRNVKDYKLDNLRKEVAMVLQQNVLFSGTIKDNLRWGNEKATDEEIMEACKIANAHDFITSFPDGYLTKLGQGGINLSGGQKQRICIARALLAKPKIIILDDSTSAVDTQTDASIRQALKQQLKDTTTIVIAQRVASVMDADRVIVIDSGEIIDIDTPENLIKTSEIYQDIYYTQMKGVEI
ncbi:MAG TPA: ABC transporter ATP-binding protein [Erysipelotrichaceae bacterium]|jgi:ATP-binding cassette subfamily B multidrug efflux pump|nr:ABC transporter ATP-binding protein [Erysipelotrichaceae bacterium]HQA85106.1 ABC transporter ATP-binding protein [Erysipelotrichaceae bacterium]